MSNFLDALKCEICGLPLEFDIDGTVDDYVKIKAVTHHSINEKIEDILEKYIVYRCTACGQPYKVTFKEIEFKVRKELTKRCYQILSRGAVESANFDSLGYFVYCGKCNGFDGCGSCPKNIYDSCKIKRFPSDGI